MPMRILIRACDQPSGSWSATMNQTTMNLWLIQKGVPMQEVKQACWIDGSEILKS